MHEYKFNMLDGSIIEIESEQDISNVDAIGMNGAIILTFDDAETSINLLQVKDMEMDGRYYEMQGYRV